MINVLNLHVYSVEIQLYFGLLPVYNLPVLYVDLLQIFYLNNMINIYNQLINLPYANVVSLVYQTSGVVIHVVMHE